MQPEQILYEAEQAIKSRHETHGDPGQQLNHTAALWQSYLGVTITPKDVAMMNVLQKVSRTCHGNHNPDDYIDINGYASLAGTMASLTTETEAPCLMYTRNGSLQELKPGGIIPFKEERERDEILEQLNEPASK